MNAVNPPQNRRWDTCVIDLDRPLTAIPVGDAEAIHIAVFAGANPLGTTVVPCQARTCTVPMLEHHLAPFRAAAYERSLLDRFEREPGSPLASSSLVVCTRGRPESLRRCLTSIGRLRHTPTETIIVDNGDGEDGTAEVCQDFPVRYVHESVPGLDRARNRGVAEASGEIVLYTDDDVELDPGWTESMLAGFRDPLVAAVTGLILPATLDGVGQIEFEEFAGFVRTTEPFVLDGTMVDATSAGRAGAGASMAYRRDFLRAVAGFPEELDGGQATQTGGDTYALYRVLDAGLRVRYEPRAVAFHHHRDSPEAARVAVRGYGTGTISYFAHGAATRRDPKAVAAAAGWAASRATKLARSLVRTGTGAQTGYLATECAGMLAAPAAYVRSRRDVASRPLILDGEHHWSPVPPPLAAAAPTGTGDSSVDLPDLSIIVPTQGQRGSLQAVLAAIAGQDYDRDRLEVIIADDSTDGRLVSAVAELGGQQPVRVVRTGGAGAAGARNAGAAAASGELLLFWDDDIEPRLASHFRAVGLAHRDGADAVIGPILPGAVAGDGFMATADRNWWLDQGTSLMRDRPLSFTDICTGNLAISRSRFERLEGFRPLPRREDWEFGVRLLRGGADVRIVTEAAVNHNDQPNLAGGIRRRRMEGQGDVHFLRLHPDIMPMTRLGIWDDLSPQRMASIRRIIANPGPSLQAARTAALGLPALERARSRQRFSKLLSRVNDLAYWAGVGEGTGGLDGWYELLSAHHGGSAQRQRPTLELTEAASWIPPLATASEVAIHHRGHFLGLAPLRWGGTPFSVEQFGANVMNRFGQLAQLVEARRVAA